MTLLEAICLGLGIPMYRVPTGWTTFCVLTGFLIGCAT